MKATKLFLTTLLLSMATYGQQAIAQDCYEQSPNLVNFGDQYYDFDETSKLLNTEKNQISDFFDSMAGQWSGRLKSFECIGPDNAAEQVSQAAEITVTNSPNANLQLTISVHKRFIENKVNFSEAHTLIMDSPNVTLQSIKDDNLVLSERLRKSSRLANKNQRRFSRLTETIYDITKSDDALLVIKHFYTNGVFTGEERWMLTAD